MSLREDQQAWLEKIGVTGFNAPPGGGGGDGDTSGGGGGGGDAGGNAPQLSKDQTMRAEVESAEFRKYYHIALKATAKKFDKPAEADEKARAIAERIVAVLEKRNAEAAKTDPHWEFNLEFFDDAVAGTAARYSDPDEIANKAYDIAAGAVRVQGKEKERMQWKNATLPQPMAADCVIVHGKVPGPKNHVLCSTHDHIIDSDARTVIAHDLDEYKKSFAH